MIYISRGLWYYIDKYNLGRTMLKARKERHDGKSISRLFSGRWAFDDEWIANKIILMHIDSKAIVNNY